MPTGNWIGDRTPEPEPPGEGRWITRPQRPRWGIRVLAGGAIVWQIPNILHNLARTSSTIAFLWIAALIFTLVYIGIFVTTFVRDRLARRMRLADRALVDGAFGEQFPAEVTLVVGGKRIGTDRGVVWFGDGLMGFSGAAASFVLAASDIRVQWRGKRRWHRHVATPGDTIALQHPHRMGSIIVAPLVGHAKAYHERLKEFVTAGERPDGERFWPPLEPYDEREMAAGLSLQEPPRL